VDIYGTGGAALARRLGTPPGGHSRGRPRRPTVYAQQLREKQKVKALYGLREGQLRRYFGEAQHLPGIAGDNLLGLLERRLDNVVYRLGFARSRPMARQMVSHGHVLVNGRRVNIPSYRVTPGETISLKPAASEMPGVMDELASGRRPPRWLLRNEDVTGHVVDQPAREDLDEAIDDNLILAFYAR
jgi:small subunit ribosomal protein S4